MCGETLRPTIWQLQFLYFKLCKIHSIFKIYCIEIGKDCRVPLNIDNIGLKGGQNYRLEKKEALT